MSTKVKLWLKATAEGANMMINNFEIWRNKNRWIAVRESDDYTIKADTFSELIIKIDQAGANNDNAD